MFKKRPASLRNVNFPSFCFIIMFAHVVLFRAMKNDLIDCKAFLAEDKLW